MTLNLNATLRAPSFRVLSERVGDHNLIHTNIEGAPPSAIRVLCELAKVGDQFNTPKGLTLEIAHA